MKETDDRYYMGKGADGLVSAAGKGASLAGKISPRSVSYTHLTLITELLEQFGKGVTICSALPTEVEVEVNAPADYVECWALCHAPHVRVTAPESLVKRIRDKLSSLQRMYQR